MTTRLDLAVAGLPRAYPGPGGAVAVLRAGEILVRHTWGWANAERRLPFTPRSLFRMCSITKQFTCAAVLDAFPDPSVLDADVRARLPNLQQPPPGAPHLCHNQSGLRDYWAVAMLHGAPAESAFGDVEAARVIAGTRTLHFAPGSRFSYVNQNFRLLSDILRDRTGQTFADLLRTRVFDRAGMETALLAADTRAMPDGTEGYEGTQDQGFRAAENRIVWTGDAGLGASLDDMIAWERHIDTTRDDPASLYARLSGPVTFADGAPAAYGFGLGRATEFGRRVTGHGGALRGWRSHRLHVAAERISIVVMFNHMSDAHDAAVDLLAATIDEDPAPPPALPFSSPPAPALPSAQAPVPLSAQAPVPLSASAPAPLSASAPAPLSDWFGAYIDPTTNLAARIDRDSLGRPRLRYGHFAEDLAQMPDGTAGSAATGLRLTPGDGGLHMIRPLENHSTLLRPCPGEPSQDVAGRYRCDELDAELTVTDAGGVLYGGFSGFLGQGRMELLDPIGADLWALPCPRALDHTPPGDWTLFFQRDETGRVGGVDVGCWLARRLPYTRIG